MIKLENWEVVGWEHAIRGMRNPMNSWEKSDSYWYSGSGPTLEELGLIDPLTGHHKGYEIGDADHDLMMRLRNAGTDHRKFMRMIVVYVDITAPLYWWKEADTYRVGVEKNSCSTMHKIHDKEFTLEDFSCEHLMVWQSKELIEDTVEMLNYYRDIYLNGGAVDLETNIVFNQDDFKVLRERGTDVNDSKYRIIEPTDKDVWWQMIQLLPTSYNQKRTVMLNYEVLANIYKSRKNHKLDEWHRFCEWIEKLPYSELITGGSENG